MSTATEARGQSREIQEKARIFLVDDHPIVLQGLAQLIDQEPDLRVCGQAENVHKTREEIQRLKPDLAVVDISLRDINGLELIKTLKIQYPKLRVLVVSMHDEAVYAERSLRAGARGYVMKDQGTEHLIAAIRKVLRGEIYLSEKMTSILLEQVARHPSDTHAPPISRLSDRELEILEMIGNGNGTRQIAKALHLSVKTIESYREHIKAKLGLDTAMQLVQYATRWVENEKSRPQM